MESAKTTKAAILGVSAVLALFCSRSPAGEISVKYDKVTGIGKEAGVVRLDASGVIKVGDRYYTWYSRKAKDQPNYQKAYNASVWYAVSEDEGHTWVEMGEAIPKGKLGEFDSSATFTPDILVWKEKYYLYYSAVGDYFFNREYSDRARTVIGLAIADSPDGPWTKLPRPILESSRDPYYFDSFRIDDASPRVVDGKVWMYYKGRPWQGEGGIHKGIQTPMHLAVADRPEGPYQRMNGGMPVQMGGHEVGIFEQDGGVYSIIANLNPNANTLRFSPDGMEFNSRKIADLRPYAPISPAIYRPELTGGKAESRQCWGLSIGLPLSGDLYFNRFEYTLPELAPEMLLGRPTPAQAAWQDLDFGVLICYDAYVYENGRVEYPNPAKVMADPNAYANMQNPEKFNTDQWLEVAKSMGASHAIFTAKHWLGFCHWQSDANPYSMKILKWRDGKGDMVKDFTDSCRKYGLAAGLFTEASEDVRQSVSKYKVTPKSPLPQSDYDCQVTGELEELCTKYGPLCEVWYDMREGRYTAPFRAIMSKHQPGAVFYGPDYRWGGGTEDGQVNYPCWATADANSWEAKILRNGDVNSKNWRPARADAPLRGSKGVHDWYWHPNREHGVDSLAKLQGMYYNCVGRNAKLIIGLTPDRDGLIPAPDAARCKEFGDWLKQTFGGKPLAETSGNGHEFTLEIPTDNTTPVTHLIMREQIMHGERVRAYVVEAEIAGAWKQVGTGSCIGHKRIEKIEPCDARKFRLRVTESIGEPMIRSFTLR